MPHYLDTSAFLKLVVTEPESDDLLEAGSRLDVVTLVAVTGDVCERAAELDPSILRSLDALHLATALTVGDGLESVVTYDDRLAAACAAHGVRVVAPGW